MCNSYANNLRYYHSYCCSFFSIFIRKLSGSKMFFRHQFLNPRAFFLLMINSSHLSSHPKQKGSDARVMSISCACFFAQCHPDMERLINSRASRMSLQRPLCIACRPLERSVTTHLIWSSCEGETYKLFRSYLSLLSFISQCLLFFHQRPRLTDTFWKDDTQRCSQSTNKRPTDHQ